MPRVGGFFDCAGNMDRLLSTVDSTEMHPLGREGAITAQGGYEALCIRQGKRYARFPESSWSGAMVWGLLKRLEGIGLAEGRMTMASCKLRL